MVEKIDFGNGKGFCNGKSPKNAKLKGQLSKVKSLRLRTYKEKIYKTWDLDLLSYWKKSIQNKKVNYIDNLIGHYFNH